MNMRQLEFFLASADTGSFYSAAEQLYVSRPAVSRAVAQLEEEAGQSLFERSADGVCLTAVGEELYPKILRLVENFKALEEEMHELQSSGRNVRIGFCHSTYLLFMERLQEFADRHPEIHMEFFHYQYEDVPEALKKGRVELIVSGYAFEDEDLVRQEAQRCKALWGVRSDSPAGRRGYITDEEIHSMPRCFPSGSRAFNLDVALSTVTDRYLEGAGFADRQGAGTGGSGPERIGQAFNGKGFILDDNMFSLCRLVLQGKAILPIGKELLPAPIEGISFVPCPEHEYCWQVDTYRARNRPLRQCVKLLLEEVFASV